MLIKKPASRFELKSYLKKKSALIFIIFFLNSIFFTFLGVYAYHLGYAALVKEQIIPYRKKEGYNNNYRIHVIKNFVRKVKSDYNILILPQWLPPIAWYFGGSVKMFLLCMVLSLISQQTSQQKM